MSSPRMPVRKMRIGPPRKGLVIDEAYLRWIRKLPCICCGTLRYVEAAHVGRRGLGQKCSDREALPICEKHHRTGPEAAHVLGRKFWAVWGLDRYRLIEEHNREYEQERSKVA
jgi:hypothetical protein